MARLVVLLLVVAGGAWYYFVGGRKIDEAQVREAYSTYFAAFDANDGKTVCDLFDKNFVATVKTQGPGGAVDGQGTRADACAGTAKFHEMKSAIEQKTGLEMHTNYEYTVVSVEIARDGKSATAHVDSEIRVGTEKGALMTIKESQTDKLVRHLGSVKFLASEGTVSMR